MPKVRAEAASVPVTLFETVTDFVPVTVAVAKAVVALLSVKEPALTAATVVLAGMFVPVIGMPTTKPAVLLTGRLVPTTVWVAVAVGAAAPIAVMTVPAGK